MNQRTHFSILVCALLLAAIAAPAQSVQEKKNIEKLCGCFDVTFKYAETFSPDPSYKFHDRDEINGGTELILPIEMSEKKMVFQHLLVISDSMIIKHWREDWTYENPVIWKYSADKTWTKELLKPDQVKGKWTQSVWEVSDAPRYQGASEWIYTDGKVFWQNTADAPLPRREYSTRSDYNVLRRTNRISINDSGWIHEQDNQKIIRNAGKERLLVEERGVNGYKRIADKNCAAAKSFWEKNQLYWSAVRKTWEEYLQNHDSIALSDSVDGKPLHEFLTKLSKAYPSAANTGLAAHDTIRSTILQFVKAAN